MFTVSNFFVDFFGQPTMMNAPPAIMDYPQVIQYQTVQKTSEQVVVQMPVLRTGELLDFPPYIQTTNTMTTTSIMDKPFNPYMDGNNSMHLPLPLGPSQTTSQVITHQSTEMLMETDQSTIPVSFYYIFLHRFSILSHILFNSASYFIEYNTNVMKF